jgi:hypothetical protein
MRALLVFIFFYASILDASEELFELESYNFSMENDAVVDTDFGYTHGARTSLLFHTGTEKTLFNFISFAYANQIYTPSDRGANELVKNDRPYAGYSYLEMGLHKSTTTTLDSLNIELGIVGPSADMQSLQDSMHKVLNVNSLNGWDHQLKDEYIFQLNYMRKWRLKYEDIGSFNSVLVPYSGVNLGNKSTKISAGALYRVGFNIPSDYGVNSMNEGGFSSLPTHSKTIVNHPSDFSMFLNLSSGANLVLKDIFLDGNTFKDSHSVDKNIVNAYVMAGVTFRYKHFCLDFFHSYYSKEFDNRAQEKTYKGYSSIVFTYNFN